MDSSTLFQKLLHAETEDAVDAILGNAGYLDPNDESAWRPLGDVENNFSAVGNQQSDPTAALIEKVINAIDAVLMAKSFGQGIDPEGPTAPQSMGEAVELFFGVQKGRIGTLDARQREALADSIHLVAVGGKTNPNYLIVDRGEGQTPERFADTFLSIMKSNKMRIPFVQGKFNSGGLGILQFCGDRNYQLIASRRSPEAPVSPGDASGKLWGFTIVRRLRPQHGRRSSMYVYLAPGGQVPSFEADAIRVLPGRSRAKQPAPPYALDLPHGTCIKLYNFRWRAKSLITLEGRYELERLLHSPALPFRVTDTREYSANYYSTTVSGGWISATDEDNDGGSTKLEEGFPAYATLNIDRVGTLPYQIAVFKEGTKKRHVPYGVYFVVNGQVHGGLPSDFVSRRLKFDYLTDKDNRGPLLVTVDCTAMDPQVREDFFMASRDRVRRNEDYATIERRLADELKSHPGLQAINQQRRKKEMEKSLDEDVSLSAFQRLLEADPSLSSLFAAGDRLVTSTGPGVQPPFHGRKFPTFFRLAKEPSNGLVKSCPVNRTCRVEFETDATNEYFERLDSPGRLDITPPNLLEHSHLWNGKFHTRFAVPWNASPGDIVQVQVKVTDVEREGRDSPFISTFTLKAAPAESDEPQLSGKPSTPRKPTTNGAVTGVALAFPKVKEIRKVEWTSYDPPFEKDESIRINNDGEGGYDYLVNIDNAFLLTELGRAKDQDKPLTRFRFTYGLVLAALGMIRHSLKEATMAAPGAARSASIDLEVDLEEVSRSCNGLARVIVPLIGSLGKETLEAGGLPV